MSGGRTNTNVFVVFKDPELLVQTNVILLVPYNLKANMETRALQKTLAQ